MMLKIMIRMVTEDEDGGCNHSTFKRHISILNGNNWRQGPFEDPNDVPSHNHLEISAARV